MSLSHKVALIDYDEDLFSPRGWEGEYMANEGIEWIEGQWRRADEVIAHAGDADVVIVQSVRKLLDAQTIPHLKKCRGMIRAGIGYDSIDVDVASQHGIVVSNVPEYCAEDVAEHALTLMLAAVRVLSAQDRQTRAGAWARETAKPTRRLQGQTLGLLAFGRIARALARRARGLGLDVICYDPFVSRETAQALGVTPVEMDELLQRADIISVHTPLTPQTRHILSTREFGLMKPTAVLVNTSRGPIVDEAALVDALRGGQILAAGLDVFEEEPLPASHPLCGMDNVVLTPHSAAYSDQAVDDLYRGACQAAIDIIRGKRPMGAVNADRL
jgi:D-3-phosphoglycerate dehydrogenase / 2-oxoglutarate reductase